MLLVWLEAEIQSRLMGRGVCNQAQLAARLPSLSRSLTHATVSTTQAATASVKPEHGSAYESPPSFVSTAPRSLIMYSAALHACSCIPHIHLRLAQTHQLDIWAACFFLAIFAYLSFFFARLAFWSILSASWGTRSVVRISPPVLAHAVGGFELHNHLLFVHYGMP